jgi:hypothetical protein
MDLIGQEVPPFLEGRTLLEPEEINGRIIFAETDVQTYSAKCVIHEGLKYIRYEGAKRGEYLFDLSRDPLEKENLIEVNVQARENMTSKLLEFIKEREEDDEQTQKRMLTEKEIEQLKSLGYVR